MNKIKTIFKIIKSPQKIIRIMGKKGILNFLSDKKYLKLFFRAEMGYKLNIDSPQTYNEKLQWLKLNDRNPLFTKLVDKYEVRDYVRKQIGEEYLIPLIGIYDSAEEINWDLLPSKFILKCTHGSRSNIICYDKKNFDIKLAKKQLKKWMRQSWYNFGREWPYKDVVPRIVCEELIENKNKKDLDDYKFYCFGGEPRFMFVATNRSIDTTADFFDLEFNHLPFEQGYKNSKQEINKPESFGKMIELSKKLAKNMCHVRVDFYESNGKVYFGELTFFDSSGVARFTPPKYDLIIGDLIDLSQAYIYKS